MIRGFEEQTFDMTSEEIEIAGHVAAYVKGIGKNNPVSAAKLASLFGLHNDVRVRKVINYIRINGLVKGLVANGRGYYSTTDVEELKRYADSLADRIAAIGAVQASIYKCISEFSNEKAA